MDKSLAHFKKSFPSGVLTRIATINSQEYWIREWIPSDFLNEAIIWERCRSSPYKDLLVLGTPLVM